MALSIGDVAAEHLRAKDFTRAADVLRSALVDDPHNARLLVQYGQACLGMKDYAAAEVAAQAALTAAPNDEYAMQQYILALHGQRRLPEATSMAWRMLSAHPQSERAQYTYASLLHEAGHSREALAAVNEALRIGPASADLLVLRGDIYQSMWGPSTGESEYLAALHLRPDHALAMHNLGVSRLRWATLTQAVRDLLAAGLLDPTLTPLVRENVGLALLRVLRMATASVVFLAVALIVVSAARDDHFSSAIPRILAAALSLALAGAIVWVVTTVPRPTLLAVLRKRRLLAVRMCFVAFAVVAGLTTAVVGSSPVTDGAGGLLVIGVFALNVLGWLTGG